MYTSPDEARSDLLLSGAVYVFGPLLVGLVLQYVPILQIPVFGAVFGILLPLVFTVLVPALLIRYRKESLADYQLGAAPSAFGQGVVYGLPLGVAAFLAGLAAGFGPGGATLPQPGQGIPVVDIAIGGSFILVLQRVTGVVGLAFLIVYGCVKARDAFRGDPIYLRSGLQQVGRFLAAAAVIASMLLVLSFVINGESLLPRLDLLLRPLGVAGAVYLVWRSVPGTQLTTRPILITAAVLAIVGRGLLSLNAVNFVLNIWSAALWGIVGLCIAAMVETRRPALAPLGLGLSVALLSYL